MPLNELFFQEQSIFYQYSSKKKYLFFVFQKKEVFLPNNSIPVTYEVTGRYNPIGQSITLFIFFSLQLKTS